LSISCRLYVKVMLSNVFFNDFCSFWSVAVKTVDKLQFLTRYVIYTSRAYAMMSVFVCLSVTEVHCRIIANLVFKLLSTFTAHCGRGACREEERDHRREEWRDHLALCYPLLGPLAIIYICFFITNYSNFHSGYLEEYLVIFHYWNSGSQSVWTWSFFEILCFFWIFKKAAVRRFGFVKSGNLIEFSRWRPSAILDFKN